jgi:uncharacterized delta-60 repeat protein
MMRLLMSAGLIAGLVLAESPRAEAQDGPTPGSRVFPSPEMPGPITITTPPINTEALDGLLPAPDDEDELEFVPEDIRDTKLTVVRGAESERVWVDALLVIDTNARSKESESLAPALLKDAENMATMLRSIGIQPTILKAGDANPEAIRRHYARLRQSPNRPHVLIFYSSSHGHSNPRKAPRGDLSHGHVLRFDNGRAPMWHASVRKAMLSVRPISRLILIAGDVEVGLIDASAFRSSHDRAGIFTSSIHRTTRRVPMKTRIRPLLETLEGRALQTAGVLDPTFGGGTGIVTTLVGSDGDAGMAVAVYPQTDPNGNAGKIVEAGYGWVGSKSEFELVRYNTDGTLDSGFGVNGHVTTLIGVWSTADTVAVQPDGKVLVGGRAQPSNSSDRNFALTRYNANGTLDATFGSGGVVTTHFALPTSKKTTYISASNISSIVIQPWDGRIVVAGGTNPVINGSQVSAFALARYNTNGTLDATFGNGGTVVTTPTSQYEGAHYVGLQTVNGVTRIVAVGDSNNYYTKVIRYTLAGAIDTSFGVNGIASLGSTPMLAMAGAIQPDGKILAAGQWSPANGGTTGFGLARFNADGSLDTTLNGTGMVGTVSALPSPQAAGAAYGVVVQPDGAIVLGGHAPVLIPNAVPQMYNSDLALARYTPTGQLDTTFGPSGTGIVLTPSLAASHALALQSDGAIVAVGNVGIGGVSEFAVSRYLGDPPAAAVAVAQSAAPVSVAPSAAPVSVAPSTEAEVGATHRPGVHPRFSHAFSRNPRHPLAVR